LTNFANHYATPPTQHHTAERESENIKKCVNAYVRSRDKFGTFNTLLPELCAGEKYYQYLRIDVAIVDELCALVEPQIIQKLAT